MMNSYVMKPVRLFAVCKAGYSVPRQVCVFSIRILKLLYKSEEHLFCAVMHAYAEFDVFHNTRNCC